MLERIRDLFTDQPVSKKAAAGVGAVSALAAGIAARTAHADEPYLGDGARTIISCRADETCRATNLHNVEVWGQGGGRVCVNVQGPLSAVGSFGLRTMRGNPVTNQPRCEGSEARDPDCDVTAQRHRGGGAFKVCASVPAVPADVPDRPEREVELFATHGDNRAPAVSHDPGTILGIGVNTAPRASIQSAPDEPNDGEQEGNTDLALRGGPMGFVSTAGLDGAGTGSSFAGEVCLGEETGTVAGCVNASVEHDPRVEPVVGTDGRSVPDPVTSLFAKLMARVRHPMGSRTTAELRVGGGVGTNLAQSGETLYGGEASAGVMARVSSAVRAGVELVGGLVRRARDREDDQTIASGGVRGVVNFNL